MNSTNAIVVSPLTPSTALSTKLRIRTGRIWTETAAAGDTRQRRPILLTTHSASANNLIKFYGCRERKRSHLRPNVLHPAYKPCVHGTHPMSGGQPLGRHKSHQFETRLVAVRFQKGNHFRNAIRQNAQIAIIFHSLRRRSYLASLPTSVPCSRIKATNRAPSLRE